MANTLQLCWKKTKSTQYYTSYKTYAITSEQHIHGKITQILTKGMLWVYTHFKYDLVLLLQKYWIKNLDHLESRLKELLTKIKQYKRITEIGQMVSLSSFVLCWQNTTITMSNQHFILDLFKVLAKFFSSQILMQIYKKCEEST